MPPPHGHGMGPLGCTMAGLGSPGCWQGPAVGSAFLLLLLPPGLFFHKGLLKHKQPRDSGLRREAAEQSQCRAGRERARGGAWRGAHGDTGAGRGRYFGTGLPRCRHEPCRAPRAVPARGARCARVMQCTGLRCVPVPPRPMAAGALSPPGRGAHGRGSHSLPFRPYSPQIKQAGGAGSPSCAGAAGTQGGHTGPADLPPQNVTLVGAFKGGAGVPWGGSQGDREAGGGIRVTLPVLAGL